MRSSKIKEYNISYYNRQHVVFVELQIKIGSGESLHTGHRLGGDLCRQT
jgi:hypothetical protein